MRRGYFKKEWKKAWKKAVKKAQIAIARRMLANQRSLDEIAEITELTLAQVEKLKQMPAE